MRVLIGRMRLLLPSSILRVVSPATRRATNLTKRSFICLSSPNLFISHFLRNPKFVFEEQKMEEVHRVDRYFGWPPLDKG